MECLDGIAVHVENRFHALLRDLSRHGVGGGLITTFRYADARKALSWRVEDPLAHERMVQRFLEQNQERVPEAW